MNYKLIALVVGSTQVLSGCFLTDSGSKSTVSASQQQYAPVIRDGVKTNFSAITTEYGYTGYLGNPDGTLSEVRVRMNEDHTIAYISKDGGPEVAYDNAGKVSSDGSTYVAGSFFNAAGDILYVQGYSNGYSAYINARENNANADSHGYGGLHTAPEDLPENADYSGFFYTQAEIGDTGASGNMTLNVDFADGSLGGGVSGTAYSSTSSTQFTGTIDGSVDDAAVTGTVTANTGATGTLDLKGAAQGDSGQYISGALAGTLTIVDEDVSSGGYFYTQEDSLQEPN